MLAATTKKDKYGIFSKFCTRRIHQEKDFPEFAAGDTITVYYEIREGDKVRTQFFKGVVIQIKGQGLSKPLQSASFLEL